MDSIPDATSSECSESTTSIPPQPHRKRKQTIFPLAHPPPKPTQRLRLTPKLLLQIQHLSPASTRPLPVLEVWQPSRFAGRLCVNSPKLRGGDMYITQSESFASLSGAGGGHSPGRGYDSASAGDEDDTGSREGGAVVSVIYNTRAQKAKSKMEDEEAQVQAEVHFPLSGRAWTASATPGGGYRFQFQGRDGDGGHVLEWRRRKTGKGERRTSGSGSSSSMEPVPVPGWYDGFMLCIVDVRTRRGARVASLTKRRLEVGCWERLPREGLQECVVASSMEARAETEAELSEEQLRTAVYTMILTMGVWVASQEGWLG